MIAYEWTPPDVILVLGVIVTGIISIISAVYGHGTKQELKTANSRTIGQQVDANTTARYMLIPVEQRTDLQVRHILDAPPEGIPVPAAAPEGNPVPRTGDTDATAFPATEAGES